jgi:hypothetical protein
MISCPYYFLILKCIKNVIDSKLFLQERNVFLYATTCSLGQLDEKINHMKISKLETKGYKENDSFLNHLANSLYSLSSKFLSLNASHMCKK